MDLFSLRFLRSENADPFFMPALLAYDDDHFRHVAPPLIYSLLFSVAAA